MEGLQLAEKQVYEVPTADIFLDEEFNCRGSIIPHDVMDLAKSIKNDGLQAPIILQPWNTNPGKKFRIVSGHRRFVAIAVVLKKATIQAIINENIKDEFQAKTLNFIENLKRKDLNMMQEAHALEVYVKAGWTYKDIAAELNVSIGWVQPRMAMLKLPLDIQQEAAAGYLTSRHIMELVNMTQAQQYEAVRKIKEARERGENKTIELTKRKVKPMERKKRTPEEIFDLQTIIRNTLGNSLVTRVMGWCAGEVSDLEIYRDIEDLCKQEGIAFSIPIEITDAYNRP